MFVVLARTGEDSSAVVPEVERKRVSNSSISMVDAALVSTAVGRGAGV